MSQRRIIQHQIVNREKAISLELLVCFNVCGANSSFPIVAMERSMTQDFLDGFLLAMMPSMLTVAWLVWRTPSGDHLPDEL